MNLKISEKLKISSWNKKTQFRHNEQKKYSSYIRDFFRVSKCAVTFLNDPGFLSNIYRLLLLGSSDKN